MCMYMCIHIYICMYRGRKRDLLLGSLIIMGKWIGINKATIPKWIK